MLGVAYIEHSPSAMYTKQFLDPRDLTITLLIPAGMLLSLSLSLVSMELLLTC